jgi:hypothetical protein
MHFMYPKILKRQSQTRVHRKSMKLDIMWWNTFFYSIYDDCIRHSNITSCRKILPWIDRTRHERVNIQFYLVLFFFQTLRLTPHGLTPVPPDILDYPTSTDMVRRTKTKKVCIKLKSSFLSCSRSFVKAAMWHLNVPLAVHLNRISRGEERAVNRLQ